MTLEQAAEILTCNRHRESEWHPFGEDAIHGKDQYDVLGKFEAVAIAEKYERIRNDALANGRDEAADLCMTGM